MCRVAFTFAPIKLTVNARLVEVNLPDAAREVRLEES